MFQLEESEGCYISYVTSRQWEILFHGQAREEHYAVVGEPGQLYLTHVSSEDSKGRTIASVLHSAIKMTALEDKLSVIGSAGNQKFRRRIKKTFTVGNLPLTLQ